MLVKYGCHHKNYIAFQNIIRLSVINEHRQHETHWQTDSVGSVSISNSFAYISTQQYNYINIESKNLLMTLCIIVITPSLKGENMNIFMKLFLNKFVRYLLRSKSLEFQSFFAEHLTQSFLIYFFIKFFFVLFFFLLFFNKLPGTQHLIDWLEKQKLNFFFTSFFFSKISFAVFKVINPTDKSSKEVRFSPQFDCKQKVFIYSFFFRKFFQTSLIDICIMPRILNSA